MGNTTISISNETHQRLADLGSKSESFNDIIKKLLEKYDKVKNDGSKK